MLILRDVKPFYSQQARRKGTVFNPMTPAGIIKEDPPFCDFHPHTTSVTFAEEDAGPCVSVVTAHNKASGFWSPPEVTIQAQRVRVTKGRESILHTAVFCPRPGSVWGHPKFPPASHRKPCGRKPSMLLFSPAFLGST